MLSILIEKTERSDTTNLQSSIFNSGLSGLGSRYDRSDRPSRVWPGGFVSDDQGTLHVLMDVTTKNRAHENKRADFVGFKGDINRPTRLNALGDIDAESL
jgi:hypothetical protein